MSVLPIYGEHKKLGRKKKTRAGKGKGNIEGRTCGLVGRTGTEWIGPLNIESRFTHGGRAGGEARRDTSGEKKKSISKSDYHRSSLTAKSSLRGLLYTPPFFPFFSFFPNKTFRCPVK